MRITDLGTRPAPRAIRDRFAPLVRGRAPAIRVERREIPYWRERGWTRTGRTYAGSYQTPYGAVYGLIEEGLSGHIEFYIYDPPREIRDHSHWTCFVPHGDDWYLVHMAKRPMDVSSGLLTIERLLTEAYRR